MTFEEWFTAHYMKHGFITSKKEAEVIWKAAQAEAGDPDRFIRSDWERAHDLLDKAGVLTVPEHQMGRHLIERLEAVLAVWEPIGRLSARTCHDLRFICNTPEEATEAIAAHRAAYRSQAKCP